MIISYVRCTDEEQALKWSGWVALKAELNNIV